MNPRKSIIKIFTWKISAIGFNAESFLNNQSVTVADNIKLLGVTIVNKLMFKQHGTSAYALSKKFNIIKILACGRNGANPEFILIIHKSLIRSKIDYY